VGVQWRRHHHNQLQACWTATSCTCSGKGHEASLDFDATAASRSWNCRWSCSQNFGMSNGIFVMLRTMFGTNTLGAEEGSQFVLQKYYNPSWVPALNMGAQCGQPHHLGSTAQLHPAGTSRPGDAQVHACAKGLAHLHTAQQNIMFDAATNITPRMHSTACMTSHTTSPTCNHGSLGMVPASCCQPWAVEAPSLPPRSG
jgi:hypothetical protein